MQSQFVGCPLTMLGIFVFIGLLGLNYLSFHLGMGLFMLLMVVQWVILLFLSSVLSQFCLLVDWESHKGYTLCFLDVITRSNDVVLLYSQPLLSHPICEVIGGTPYVFSVWFQRLSLDVGGRLHSPCVIP
jgi:hypothetical protein